jgi:hypothetical protein
MGLAFCIFAFVATLLLTWRSLAAGIVAVITIGYFFGILRANLYPDLYSHFIFDSAVVGCYLSYFGFGGLKKAFDPQQEALRRWTSVLIGWGVLMSLIPIQHPLIQLVGLRGNVFLLPFLLVGGRVERETANTIGLSLGVLNHIAFAFAMAEYFFGVPMFYPENTVTELIYNSGDVGSGGNLRIPATFSNAHSYGGAMAFSLPWLLGAWVQPGNSKWRGTFLLSAIAVGMAGVFLCAARTPVVMLGFIVVAATFSGHLRGASWMAWALLIAGLAYIISGEERMQRFLTMEDSEQVIGRIGNSVNMTFLQLIVAYPFGNGMGAGGTSVPHFLQHYLIDPVVMENEYCRILLEQGVAGLALWIVFIFWFLFRRPVGQRDPWLFGRKLLWSFGLAAFAMAVLGTGLMTSIPQSTLFFLGIGFVVTPAPVLKKRPKPIAKSIPSSTHIMAKA